MHSIAGNNIDYVIVKMGKVIQDGDGNFRIWTIGFARSLLKEKRFQYGIASKFSDSIC